MNPEFGRNQELSEITTRQLAILYAEVFGAPPWNEVWRCQTCNRFYGPEYPEGATSPCCSMPLIAAYPETETIDYILTELSKPKARLELTYTRNGQIEAFAWGYQFENVSVFAQKKWPQSEIIQAQVTVAISRFTPVESPSFYISEVGVSPPSRGNRIGLRLTSILLEYGLGNGLPVIFRTNWASPMMRIAARLEMTQIMGPKIEVINNEIAKTGEIAGFVDGINPDRTLFIKLPQL